MNKSDITALTLIVLLSPFIILGMTAHVLVKMTIVGWNFSELCLDRLMKE